MAKKDYYCPVDGMEFEKYGDLEEHIKKEHPKEQALARGAQPQAVASAVPQTPSAAPPATTQAQAPAPVPPPARVEEPPAPQPPPSDAP